MKTINTLNFLFISLIVTTSIAFAEVSQDPTLLEVLQKNELNQYVSEDLPLATRVNGAEIFNSNDEALIAAGIWGANNLIDEITAFHINKKTAKWQRIKLTQNDIGSVLSVSKIGNFYVIKTHLTPSAATTVLLDSNLIEYDHIHGWIEFKLSNTQIIYHESMVHFAPIHETVLYLYDLPTKKAKKIFPLAAPDMIRQSFSNQIKIYYDKLGEKWCMEHNHPCDPNRLDSSVWQIIITDTAKIAFIANYSSPYNRLKNDQLQSKHVNVLYVLKNIDRPDFDFEEYEIRDEIPTIYSETERSKWLRNKYKELSSVKK